MKTNKDIVEAVANLPEELLTDAIVRESTIPGCCITFRSDTAPQSWSNGFLTPIYRPDGGTGTWNTAGDEHGDCAEPFRTPRGWGIHTMLFVRK